MKVQKGLFWRHAVAERLIKRADECVRAAVIQVSDEKGHVKLLQCSIQHLRDSSEDSTNELPPIDDTQSLSQGSTRTASTRFYKDSLSPFTTWQPCTCAKHLAFIRI